MGVVEFGKNVVVGAVDALTSPFRAVWHAGRAVVNAAHLVASAVTFGLAGSPAEQWSDLKDSLKGAAFAGAEALLTYGTGGVGLLFTATRHGAVKSVLEVAKDAVVKNSYRFATATATAMVEDKFRE